MNRAKELALHRTLTCGDRAHPAALHLLVRWSNERIARVATASNGSHRAVHTLRICV